MKSDTRHEGKASLVVLAVIHGICAFRYFPGRGWDSFRETIFHLAAISPFLIGVTLILTIVLQRLLGVKLLWTSVFRIFFTVGIIMELLLGIHDYLGKAAGFTSGG